MGASHPKNTVYGEGTHTLQYLQQILHLTEDDIVKIYTIYHQSLDVEKLSCISFFSFSSYIHCEDNPYLYSIIQFFSSFNKNKEQITFAEFLLFLYFYLTLTEENLAEFLFLIITEEYNSSPSSPASPSSSDSIPKITIEKHIQRLFGQAWGNEHKIHHILSVIDHDQHGAVSLNQFKTGLHANRSLLFHIVSYQMDIKKKILSESYWESKQGLGSTLIGSIRKIRDTVHRYEEQDFKHENVGEHKLDRKASIHDDDDRYSMTLPVSNHTNRKHILFNEDEPSSIHVEYLSRPKTSYIPEHPSERPHTATDHLPHITHSHSKLSSHHRKLEHTSTLPLPSVLNENSVQHEALLHPLTDHTDRSESHTNESTSHIQKLRVSHNSDTIDPDEKLISPENSKQTTSPNPRSPAKEKALLADHTETKESHAHIHALQKLRMSHNSDVIDLDEKLIFQENPEQTTSRSPAKEKALLTDHTETKESHAHIHALQKLRMSHNSDTIDPDEKSPSRGLHPHSPAEKKAPSTPSSNHHTYHKSSSHHHHSSNEKDEPEHKYSHPMIKEIHLTADSKE